MDLHKYRDILGILIRISLKNYQQKCYLGNQNKAHISVIIGLQIEEVRYGLGKP